MKILMKCNAFLINMHLYSKNNAFRFYHFGAAAKKQRKFESVTFDVDSRGH